MRKKKLEKIRKENNDILMRQEEKVSKLERRIIELTDILLEANIIEDIDMTDVKYRDVLVNSWYGSSYTVKTPYIINEVKVKQ